MQTFLRPSDLVAMYGPTLAAAAGETLHPGSCPCACQLDDFTSWLMELESAVVDQSLDAEESGDTETQEHLENVARLAEIAREAIDDIVYDDARTDITDSTNAWRAHECLAELVRVAGYTPDPRPLEYVDPAGPPPGTPEGQPPHGACMHCGQQRELFALEQEEYDTEGPMGRHRWLCSGCWGRGADLRDEYRRLGRELRAFGTGQDPWPWRHAD